MTKPDNSIVPPAANEPTGAAFAAPSLSSTAAAGADRSNERPEPYSPQEVDCRRCLEGLSTAAHDLKTPVAILSGYIELMLSEKLGQLSARQRTAMQEMHDNCQRLHGFVKNFLALGAFRNSPVELQLVNQDLNACLAEIIQVWIPSFQRKAVALFFSPSDQLPLFAFDYYKVQHVVSNLLDNALKFSSAGGSVWITAEQHLWERRSRQGPLPSVFDRRRTYPSLPNTVRVSVTDSGPGIASEFHQEIFQEYFRVNHATEGHGLGLAIAQRLVTRFGGKIWVESEPGLGAKFAFLLPLKPTG
jgi:signal transduction histidine kinase